jgi:anti-sigma factor RsiW
MTNDQHVSSCPEYAGNLAELALGILTGRDRAAALAHVESCANCAEELEQLARAADAVVQVAPEVEPPVGFEVSLFSRMGVDEVALRRRPGPTRWMLAGAAAVVALAIGLGIGWSAGSHPPGPTTTKGPSVRTPVEAANLMENGRSVGRVSAYGGSTPWLSMTLADSTARGRVTCRVVTADGATHTVGSFESDHGYGAWGAPLSVTPQDVRQAQVVSANGTVIATATLG